MDAAPQAGPSPQWLERLQAGDIEALGTLVDELYPSMVRLTRSMLGGDSAQAQDLVQETWVAVMVGLSSFEGRSSLKTWILRILVNRTRTEMSRRGRTEQVAWLDSEPTDSEPAVQPNRFAAIGWWRDPPRSWDREGPEGPLVRKQLRELVLRELDTLPAGQRTVVGLRDVEGLSSEEVRAVLGITQINQRVLLHRGRSRIRAALEREMARGGE
jgi:RNA polymerase sigma-70 factor (ECF subfamily)